MRVARAETGSREGGGTFGLPGSETAEEVRACNKCSFSPTSSSQAPDAGFPLASKQALRALNQTLFFFPDSLEPGNKSSKLSFLSCFRGKLYLLNGLSLVVTYLLLSFYYLNTSSYNNV